MTVSTGLNTLAGLTKDKTLVDIAIVAGGTVGGALVTGSFVCFVSSLGACMSLEGPNVTGKDIARETVTVFSLTALGALNGGVAGGLLAIAVLGAKEASLVIAEKVLSASS